MPGSRFRTYRVATCRSRICSWLSRGFSARAIKTGEEKHETEKQRNRVVKGMPRSRNYAVFSDVLLPGAGAEILPRVLSPRGED